MSHLRVVRRREVRKLKQGDRIIGIGQGVDGEIQDVVGMRLDDVVAQIRGEKGTVVRLSVIPADAVSESARRRSALLEIPLSLKISLLRKKL